MMKKILLMLVVLVAYSSMAKTPEGIYGEDNRVDVYASPNASFRELSKSTAAMFEGGSLKKGFSGTHYNILGSKLKKRLLCPTERFAEQITASVCSGFLVTPTTLVTAGHCIKHQADCSTYRWVFDYRVDKEGEDIKIPENSVYDCKKLIGRQRTTTNDWAYIELDRPVTDRRPLKVRRSGTAAVGDELVIIGHPSGLPTKIADGAKVRSVSKDFFVSNVDSYGGNSGSAVINVKTEEVEGILVRGGKDYEISPGKQCYRNVVCAENACDGESATYIINVGIK